MNAEVEFRTFTARGSKLLHSLGVRGQVSTPDGIRLWQRLSFSFSVWPARARPHSCSTFVRFSGVAFPRSRPPFNQTGCPPPRAALSLWIVYKTTLKVRFPLIQEICSLLLPGNRNETTARSSCLCSIADILFRVWWSVLLSIKLITFCRQGDSRQKMNEVKTVWLNIHCLNITFE